MSHSDEFFYDDLKIKWVSREKAKEKLVKKGVKHWYWDIGRNIDKLRWENMSKELKEVVVWRPLWLTKKKLKKFKGM